MELADVAARWGEAGNRSTLPVYPEAMHGFTAFPLGIARIAGEEMWAFVRDAVA